MQCCLGAKGCVRHSVHWQLINWHRLTSTIWNLLCNIIVSDLLHCQLINWLNLTSTPYETIIVSVSLHCQLIIWSRLTFTVWSLHTRTRWPWVIFQQKTQLFPENKSLGFIWSIWIYSGIWLWTARRCQRYLMSELPGIPGVLVARTMGWDWLRVQIRLNLHTTILETLDFWVMWSVWWGDMTWPTKWQIQIEIHLGNSLKEQPLIYYLL